MKKNNKEIITGIQSVTKEGVAFQIKTLDKVIEIATDEDVVKTLRAKKEALQALKK